MTGFIIQGRIDFNFKDDIINYLINGWQKLKKLFLGLLFLFVFSGMAQATTVLTWSIKVDDSFFAYLSTEDTTQGTQFGAGNQYWTTYTGTTTPLTAGQDYYLHVYGYNGGGASGLQGTFSLSGNDHYFSNNTTTLSTTEDEAWKGSLLDWGDYGRGEYILAGQTGTPRWMWVGSTWDWHREGGVYFSSKISATPEPTTMLLFGLGLLGVAGVARRKS